MEEFILESTNTIDEQTQKKTRVSTACSECTKAHRKCDGSYPCSRCATHGIECIFVLKKKRGPKRKDSDAPATSKRKRAQMLPEQTHQIIADPIEDVRFITTSILSQLADSTLVQQWYKYSHPQFYTVELPSYSEVQTNEAKKFLLMSALCHALQTTKNMEALERMERETEFLWESKLRSSMLALKDRIDVGLGLVMFSHHFENIGNFAKATMFHFLNYQVSSNLPSIEEDNIETGNSLLVFPSKEMALIHYLKVSALIHMLEASPQDESYYLQKLRKFKLSSKEMFIEIMHRLATIRDDELLAQLDMAEERHLEESIRFPPTSNTRTIFNGSFIVPHHLTLFNEMSIYVMRGCCYMKKGNRTAASLQLKRAIQRLGSMGGLRMRPLFFIVYGCAILCALLKDDSLEYLIPILIEYKELFTELTAPVDRCIMIYEQMKQEKNSPQVIPAVIDGSASESSSPDFIFPEDINQSELMKIFGLFDNNGDDGTLLADNNAGTNIFDSLLFPKDTNQDLAPLIPTSNRLLITREEVRVDKLLGYIQSDIFPL